MAEPSLLLMTEKKLFGMNLARLIKMGREEEEPVPPEFDWESIPPLLLDFSVDLPETDRRDLDQFGQYHFVFDSKLYVARGGLVNRLDIEGFIGDDKKAKAPSRKKKKKISHSLEAGGSRRGLGTSIDDIRECIAHMPCCKTYQFDVDTKGLTWPEVHSVPPLPTPFAPCFLGNIIPSSGDVYCLVYHKSRRPQFEGLWVLRSSSSSSGEWERLSSPPPLDDEGFGDDYNNCFVSQDKLFLQVYNHQRKPALYCFDPTTAKWTHVDDHIMHSFYCGTADFCFPSVTMSLPGLTDCSVAFHCEAILDRSVLGDKLKVIINALMLNNQTGAVSLFQSLDECFEGMETTNFVVDTAHIELADLGNSTVCALLYGCTEDHEDPVLCMSVFTLTVAAEQQHFVGAEEEEAPQKKQTTKFLNVQVHVKRLFPINNDEYEDLGFLRPFVFMPDKEDRIHASSKGKKANKEDSIHTCSKGERANKEDSIHACSKGTKANKANKVSFSNLKRKELLFVNLPKKRIWWKAWKRSVKRRTEGPSLNHSPQQQL